MISFRSFSLMPSLCSRVMSSGFLYGRMASKWIIRSRNGRFTSSGFVSVELLVMLLPLASPSFNTLEDDDVLDEGAVL